MKQVDEGGYQDQDLFANVWTWGTSLLADELRARTALSQFNNLKLQGLSTLLSTTYVSYIWSWLAFPFTQGPI
jgi:hypothetical protein